MGASVRGFWREAKPYQRLCYVTGAALMVLGLLHLVGFVVLGGPWVGPVAWRKPFSFGLSFGLTTMTVAWIGTYLPMPRWVGWLLFGPLAVANTLEVLWVTVQRARGRLSHFNMRSPLDETLFMAAAAAIAVTVVVIAVLTVLAFARIDAPPSMASGIRGGLVALIFAMAVGVLMIGVGIAAVDAGRPPVMTFGEAGSLKVPHAAGMHGIQVLPGLAWLLSFTTLPGRRQQRLVRAACAGYLGIVLVSAVQTFGGLAPWDLRLGTGALLLASLLLLAVPVVSAIRDA